MITTDKKGNTSRQPATDQYAVHVPVLDDKTKPFLETPLNPDEITYWDIRSWHDADDKVRMPGDVLPRLYPVSAGYHTHPEGGLHFSPEDKDIRKKQGYNPEFLGVAASHVNRITPENILGRYIIFLVLDSQGERTLGELPCD